MAAQVLVGAGMRVLMLERGDWVERDPRVSPWAVGWADREAYSEETPYLMESRRNREKGAFHCVGGPSVFFGGVGLRLRERDFAGDPAISGDIRWCIDYDDLRADYDRAEALMGLSGDDADDATAPPRGRPLPPTRQPLSATSRAVREAALRLGLHPFRLPLAIHEDGSDGRRPCSACGVCDGFACATGSKNDLATTVLPDLIRNGLVLRPNTVAVGFEVSGTRARSVLCIDRLTGVRRRFHARRFVLAAGALGTPHLLLSSDLQALNPAGWQVGRNLMRHCNAIVLGAAPAPVGEARDFRKQLGIHDFYFGGPSGEHPAGKLGSIQQIRATRIALSMAPLPAGLKELIDPWLSRLVGFIVMAEDQPLEENRIFVDPRRKDVFGRPVARIRHAHSARDRAARRALVRQASRILREMGVAFTFSVPVNTFSHGVGTVRMGEDPERFPVDPDGRFRGADNIWVTDGSLFPTSGGVNPSLTIAANAMRIARQIVTPTRVHHPRATRERRTRRVKARL